MSKSFVFFVLLAVCYKETFGLSYIASTGPIFNFNYTGIGGTGWTRPPYDPPIDSYAQINNYDLSSYSEFTVEFWTSWVAGGGPYSYKNLSSSAFYYGTGANYLAINPNSGTYADGYTRTAAFNPYSTVKVASSTGNVTMSSALMNQNNWCHVAFSKSASNATFILHCITAFNKPTDSLSESENVTTIGGAEAAQLWNGISGTVAYLAKTPITNQYYPSMITELRLWNVSRTPQEVASTRKYSLNGDEANLVSYFRMDEGSGNTVYDSIDSSRTGTLFNALWSTQQDYLYNFVQYAQLYNARRTIPWNGQTSLNIYYIDDIGSTAMGILVTQPALDLAVGGVPITSTFPLLDFSVGYNFTLDITANRASCNTLQTFTIQVQNANGSPLPTNNQNNITITIGGFTSSSQITGTGPLAPTNGGSITLTGSNLGLDGALASNEVVEIQFAKSTVSCSNGVVSSGGTVLTCNLGAGVGEQGNVLVTLCTNNYTFNQLVSYQAPTITTITKLTSSSIQISGTNFGPGGRTIQSTDYITLIPAQGGKRLSPMNCTMNVVGHTSIICSLPTNITDSIYNVALSIGGQVTQFNNFNYTLCDFPCENNGTCMAPNQCNCLSTGYTGTYCTTILNCNPSCKNGVCTLHSNDTICVCQTGYQGLACDTIQINAPPAKPLGAIIGGSVGGGVLVIILLVVVIVLAVRRKPQRGTSNFIPLEKKDFTNIIYGEQLNQSVEKHSGNLEELEKLLIQDNLELAFAVSAITQITEADKVAKAMVVVFEQNDKILPLLEAFVNDEVRTTEQAGTLFRSNSMVSKMFKFYSRLIGLPYLYTTIGPEMDELISEELGLEVDPEKMEEGTDLDEMRWTLMAQSQKILKAIMNSVEDCPPQFRDLFAHIKRCVAERFAENVNTTIGGFIFLRFFCPAVSSPEAYGIVEEPPNASARRLLILITKVLQNLSNDVEFGSKEPYMTKMNDFIQSNRAKLEQFYDKLVKPSSKPAVKIDMPRNIKPVSLSVLSLHIRENLAKIDNAELRQKLQAIVGEN